MPTYTPTSAWLVGPASLGETEGYAGQMPCVVANQFGNGFVLRLSGGGGQLMAMAIDFRQKAFAARQKYEVEFSVPGVFFQSFAGSAYDETTLLFGLSKIPEFYKALQGAESLVITVGGASVGLNLVGLEDGFRRMDACYGPGQKEERISEFQQDREEPSSLKSSTQNPLITPKDGLTPLPEDEISETPPVAPSEADSLIAKAKEAEDAARRLAASSPSKPAAEGQAMASSWTEPKVVRPNPSDIMVQKSAPPPASTSRNMRWRALKGANLQDVLGLWTSGVDVRLMWLADSNFPVMRSLSFEGNFESAVQSLLEQYSGQGDRPVGRIYREPGSQKLVLVIERDRTSP
ncbi:MAG: TcpQ domain-containing protein [Micavibrio sp.]